MIKNSIFSEKGESFLRNKMCICIDDLTNKILTDAPEHIKFFKNIVDGYLKLGFHSSTDKFLNIKQSKDNEAIFESCLKYDETLTKLEEYPKVRSIYEAFYFLLRNYLNEGLSGVWYHQDSLSWYPKILITKNFGSRDVLDRLNDIITIYRGTSEDEFNSNKFSQAWSLEKSIADEFAFKLYQNSDNYKDVVRVVIQAQINKNDIYHYRNNHREAEVIINPTKLIDGSISIIKKKL
jgi:hypothetical protein